VFPSSTSPPYLGQFRVHPADLRKKTAEMVYTSAYVLDAA
jgi:hypothetical protein